MSCSCTSGNCANCACSHAGRSCTSSCHGGAQNSNCSRMATSTTHVLVPGQGLYFLLFISTVLLLVLVNSGVCFRFEWCSHLITPPFVSVVTTVGILVSSFFAARAFNISSDSLDQLYVKTKDSVTFALLVLVISLLLYLFFLKFD